MSDLLRAERACAERLGELTRRMKEAQDTLTLLRRERRKALGEWLDAWKAWNATENAALAEETE